MFDRIVIENFKSLRRVDLKLGALNVFIGTNASGKSNFFDALRVLQGIGYGFSLREIFDGRPKGGTSEVWEGIRGGASMALSSICSKADLIGIRLLGHHEVWQWDYSIALSPITGLVDSESLLGTVQGIPVNVFDSRGETALRKLGSFPIVRGNSSSSLEDAPQKAAPNWAVPMLGQLRDNLSALPEDLQRSSLLALCQMLRGMIQFEPDLANLRSYSSKQVGRIGAKGENFAGLVELISLLPRVKSAYVQWLREMRPNEVDDVELLSGALGEPMFAIREGGKIYPAPALSDGTLRFAAIAAALFQPELPSVILLEEVESGIHPSRLRLLIELLRNRAQTAPTQLIVTTHSPAVLAWLKPEEYATTFLCQRDPESGESSIRPLTEVPHFAEAIRTQSIAELFTEGWLEAVA